MYKIDQDAHVVFGNVQIQSCKYEPLESDSDSARTTTTTTTLFTLVLTLSHINVYNYEKLKRRTNIEPGINLSGSDSSSQEDGIAISARKESTTRIGETF